ncbi:MAG: hypothetical protein R3D71_05910 [Rickettsiales bacterium]
MTDDHIDRSCFLPRGVDFITPQRLAKGDLRVSYNDSGQMQEAQATVKNILNWFWENDYITHEQHDDACTFQIWRDMHQVSMGVRKPVSSGEVESLGVKLRAYGFVLLLKKLSRHNVKAIEYVLENFASEHNIFFAKRDRRVYQSVLQDLSEKIIPVREQIKYLESLDESEREKLYEENLQKLVAQIKKHA